MSWLGRSFCLFILVSVMVGIEARANAAAPQTSHSVSAPALKAATRPTTGATSRTSYGPEVVMLDELVSMYEPVPFAHRKHAEMAEMWGGCTSCHHHTPDANAAKATSQPLAATGHAHKQAEASAIPACKSCHPAESDEGDIRMPSLKGAYHRQCLNCHREWMEANACVACHAAKGENPTSAPSIKPAPGDIVGRMHKPIPAPTTKVYDTRFTPAAGAKVMFRHEEHVKFGLKCVACHRNDSCASCHAAPATAPATGTSTAPVHAAARPLHPGKTWKETHGPCVSCHEQDHCDHCHYASGQAPPAPFDHSSTGQILDKDHIGLACGECHKQFKTKPEPSCGGSACHKRPVSHPKDRPGPVKVSATRATSAPASQPTTSPATRPVMIRIRRGGL